METVDFNVDFTKRDSKKQQQEGCRIQWVLWSTHVLHNRKHVGKIVQQPFPTLMDSPLPTLKVFTLQVVNGFSSVVLLTSPGIDMGRD